MGFSGAFSGTLEPAALSWMKLRRLCRRRLPRRIECWCVRVSGTRSATTGLTQHLFPGPLRLPAEQVRFEVGDAVQEEDAVQVVQLVLEDDCLEAGCRHLDRLSLEPLRMD